MPILRASGPAAMLGQSLTKRCQLLPLLTAHINLETSGSCHSSRLPQRQLPLAVTGEHGCCSHDGCRQVGQAQTTKNSDCTHVSVSSMVSSSPLFLLAAPSC